MDFCNAFVMLQDLKVAFRSYLTLTRLFLLKSGISMQFLDETLLLMSKFYTKETKNYDIRQLFSNMDQ